MDSVSTQIFSWIICFPIRAYIRVKMAKEQVMGMEKKIDHVIAGLKAAKLSLPDRERKIEKELNHWSVAGSV